MVLRAMQNEITQRGKFINKLPLNSLPELLNPTIAPAPTTTSQLHNPGYPHPPSLPILIFQFQSLSGRGSYPEVPRYQLHQWRSARAQMSCGGRFRDPNSCISRSEDFKIPTTTSRCCTDNVTRRSCYSIHEYYDDLLLTK
jgi:hypothetical protein